MVLNDYNSGQNQYNSINRNAYQDQNYSNQDNYNNKRQSRNLSVLMVAEKPSIAKTIAESLSNNRFRTRKGESKFVSIHEFESNFMGQKASIKSTAVTGHVYARDFPKEYSDWYRIDPMSLFEAPTIKKEANPESYLVRHLETEAIGCSYIVLWLDNDREGENICFEVLDICKPRLENMNGQQQIYRAKFSSITKKDICHAYDSLREGPNINESISVDARQIIDLKQGGCLKKKSIFIYKMNVFFYLDFFLDFLLLLFFYNTLRKKSTNYQIYC